MKSKLSFYKLSFFVRKNSSVNDGIKPVLLSSETYVNAKVDGSVAPPVLIAHGLCGSKANWQHVAHTLANKCKPQRKIITMDVRNHGESPHVNEHSYEHMSADLRYLMEVKKIAKATILGHSLGGRCAMYFTLTQPNRTEKLIVFDISPINEESQFILIKSHLDLMHKVKFPQGVSKHQARNDVDKQLSVKIRQPLIRQFLLTNLTEKNGSFTWRVNLPVLIKKFHYNISLFPNVEGKVFEGPVLFLIGEKSDFVREKDYASINKLFPQARFVKIPNAGHLLHVENPNEIIKQCVDFLNN